MICEIQSIRREYYNKVAEGFIEGVKNERDVKRIVMAILNEENILQLNKMLDTIEDLDDNIEDIDKEINAIHDGCALFYNEKTNRINKIRFASSPVTTKELS